jgi:IS30 family transposase
MPGTRLTLEDRELIGLGVATGSSLAALGRRLGRPTSTVSREVARHGGRKRYRGVKAHHTAKRSARRPKARKLVRCKKLARMVEHALRRAWSPEQIAAHLHGRYPDKAKYRVSHETIYHALYLQGRGGLRKELTKALRSGRVRRRSQKPRKRPLMENMVMISERPPEVADRAVPGHWEGDLVIGHYARSQIGTLVERASRFVLLVRLPNGRGATHVRKAVARKIRSLPGALKRSLTWDQGREMAEHVRFTIDTGVQVYFCDPHSPWQRGSNENTNGLLREFLPRTRDLSTVTAEELRKIENLLNGRPRKTLGWMTPSEKLAQIVAMTA